MIHTSDDDGSVREEHSDYEERDAYVGGSASLSDANQKQNVTDSDLTDSRVAHVVGQGGEPETRCGDRDSQRRWPRFSYGNEFYNFWDFNFGGKIITNLSGFLERKFIKKV
ncbi:hypothetical protein ACS0TY_013476 [Phlomoides rotata]